MVRVTVQRAFKPGAPFIAIHSDYERIVTQRGANSAHKRCLPELGFLSGGYCTQVRGGGWSQTDIFANLHIINLQKQSQVCHVMNRVV